MAHVKSIGGSENLTPPEKAKRQAKKKNKGGSRPQALIPEKKFYSLDNDPRISYSEATKEKDMNNKTLERIAKALEELIALVKEDLKPRKKK